MKAFESEHVIPLINFNLSNYLIFKIMKLTIIIAVLFMVLQAAVIPFDNQAVDKIFNQKNDALFLFVGDEEAEKYALEAFQAFDQTNPSVILSLSSKNDGHGLFDRLAEYLGVSTTSTPQILFLRDASKKYKYSYDQVTAQNLADFVQRVNRGEIQLFLKSAAIPETNEEPVKVVVGKTFKEYVFDSQKEVLVKFYAPWCGHCKHIAPHFDEAAKKLLNNPNVLLIKVDSTENQVQGLNIQSFPTIKFWRKDKSAIPLDFNGQRTADGIIDWIRDHTEYEWVEPNSQTQTPVAQDQQL